MRGVPQPAERPHGPIGRPQAPAADRVAPANESLGPTLADCFRSARGKAHDLTGAFPRRRVGAGPGTAGPCRTWRTSRPPPVPVFERTDFIWVRTVWMLARRSAAICRSVRPRTSPSTTAASACGAPVLSPHQFVIDGRALFPLHDEYHARGYPRATVEMIPRKRRHHRVERFAARGAVDRDHPTSGVDRFSGLPDQPAKAGGVRRAGCRQRAALQLETVRGIEGRLRPPVDADRGTTAVEKDHTDPERIERCRCRIALRPGDQQMMAKLKGSTQTGEDRSEQRQIPACDGPAPPRSAEAEHPRRLALASDHSAGKMMDPLWTKPIVVVLGAKKDTIRTDLAAELDDSLSRQRSWLQSPKKGDTVAKCSL